MTAMNPVVATLLRLLALVRKELLVVLKDPANRMILVVPVLMQSLVFGYAATYDLKQVPYAVLDLSRSVSSSQLLARLDGTGVFARVADLSSPAQVAPRVERGEALMVVVVPPDFERLVLGGSTAHVQVILDGRNSTTAGTAALYLEAVVAAFNADLRERAGAPAAPALQVETRAWYNPNLETRWNFMPALIASLSLLQTLLLTALSVAREREQGTFDQLLVTPLSPVEIMIAKALPPIAIGLVQSAVVLGVTRFWFGVPMAGSPLVLFTCLLVFTVAAVGIGLSISAVSRHMQQAMLITFVLVMPMMLLSGLSTPVETMPRALQLATWINPLRFGIDAVRRVYLEGAGLATVAPDFIPLLAIAAVTMPVAAWLFRHRLA
jgi:ABC-2 type transport system permease protein